MTKNQRVKTARRMSRPSRQARIKRTINIPGWLKRKLSFTVSDGETSETFFRRIGQLYPESDARYKLIYRAYDCARKEFQNEFRDSGERYFEHLRASTLILIEYMRVRDPEIISAMLLHDIVEDIKGWDHNRVSREFGEVISGHVFWMTKPELGGHIETPEDVDRAYHSQLRAAPREAILMKVADRLHNLITMWHDDEDRMRRKTSETRDFILPLAEKHQLLVHELEAVLDLIDSRLDR